MASAPATGPEPMVTIKVFYDGATRRGKMPLREMVPPALEQHIRDFLHIPAETETLIERYSDSAAAYVLLDTANVAVYKQLYRAAKAKLKLKFRVTLKNTEEKTSPQPVTVEDEPETATLVENPIETKAEENKDKDVLSSSSQTDVSEAPQVPEASPSQGETVCVDRSLPKQWSKVYEASALKQAAGLASESQDLFRQQFESRIQSLMERNAGLATHMAQQQEHCRALLNNHRTTNAANTSPGSAPWAPACHAAGATFAVCCNSCERTMPDAHYHCSTCDDGDFDLCQSCVDQGISCYSNEHWLIKRTIGNGQIIYSTTETIAPKQKAKSEEKKEEPAPEPAPKPAAKPETVAPLPPKPQFSTHAERWASFGNVRTCNSCIRELPEKEFLHCDDCEDFDLCHRCFSQGKHGHHPRHRFAPATSEGVLPDHIKVKLSPGRNQLHHAICDGCDKYVTGVRHKCLDCPDWDYCSACYEVANFVHPNHRFVPIYEPLSDVRTSTGFQPVHTGICCDGPLCSVGKGYPSYIRGTRYKCAVCHDLDFCANCEASPSNEHNKTHPLIKFKTPVRHVSVTTTGEHHDGKRMPAMGDRTKAEDETVMKQESSEAPSLNAIQTVVDVKPEETTPIVEEEPKEEITQPEVQAKEEETTEAPISPTESQQTEEELLSAVFVRDSVADGTILPPNHVFEQTWVLRNDGNVAWPAGCSVKFVGGDYMGHVDSAHPAGISELVSASESTVCYAPLAAGQEFSFTVLLRTPARAGKIVSYWRLTTGDGHKFGHRLWCDVNVRVPEPVEEPKMAEEPKATNLMFPKLEKESPVSSIHEDSPAGPATPEKVAGEDEESEDYAEDADWDASDDGFMTDEEYDILDASDEEYLEEQQKKLLLRK
ncbi:hypothetical protein HJFPF1_01959 [Paramyrothecium foliicola]|nr:hypothetical protein HJFPF1_01959 [Paramyrothecium foliicola]